MSATNKVFKVSGNKVEGLLLSEDAFLLSSKYYQDATEFSEAWDRKLSLATKSRISYDSVRSISKDDSGETMTIKYKGKMGIPSECQFSFSDQDDRAQFFDFLEKEQRYQRTEERLSPLKAAGSYILGLLFTIAITIFSYYQYLGISDGSIDTESGSRKSRSFYNIIGLLGDKGILLIGSAIAIYCAFNIYKRFTNPPMQTRFQPMS